MKNYYKTLRDFVNEGVSVMLLVLIPAIAIAQDAVIQSPMPQYRADEVNQRIIPELILMLDEPVTVGLEIRVQDIYYTGIGYHDTSEDISESLSEKAVIFLNTTQFQGESVSSALQLIAAHIHEDIPWSDRLVTVGLSVPPLFRGWVPFRLAMETGKTMRMQTSFTLINLQANIHDNEVFDLELNYETDSDLLIDPYQIRSSILDYLNETQLLPERVEVFNRMLAGHLHESFDDIHWIRSVIKLGETTDFPVQLESVLSVTPSASISITTGIQAESVTMTVSGFSETTPEAALPGYELQLVYENGLEGGDFPNFHELHDLIRQAIDDPDSASGNWIDFMNETLEAINVVAGNAAREISLYVDSNSANVVEEGENRIRYLARKAEPNFLNRILYTGYELNLSSLETYLGTAMDFRLEITDYWYPFEASLPEPEALADSLRAHALNPVAHPTSMENDVMLNRYLNSLAYNFGSFSDWDFLMRGTIDSGLSGINEDGTAFSHILEGAAGFDSDSSVPKETGIPSAIRLFQNYPNPFNPQTTITFEIGQAGDITLDIYDLTGRKIAVVAEGLHQQGVHHATFDAGNLASGMYMARLQSAAGVLVLKMMLIK